MTDLYTSQRAMRNMRRAAMQRGVIAILDVGTSKIACLILRFDGPDRLREQDGVGPMAGQSQFHGLLGSGTCAGCLVVGHVVRMPVLLLQFIGSPLRRAFCLRQIKLRQRRIFIMEAPFLGSFICAPPPRPP